MYILQEDKLETSNLEIIALNNVQLRQPQSTGVKGEE